MPIDFPDKLRSTRRDHKLVDAAAIDGLTQLAQRTGFRLVADLQLAGGTQQVVSDYAIVDGDLLREVVFEAVGHPNTAWTFEDHDGLYARTSSNKGAFHSGAVNYWRDSSDQLVVRAISTAQRVRVWEFTQREVLADFVERYGPFTSELRAKLNGIEEGATAGGDGADPLIENVFDGTTGSGRGEAQVSEVAVENSANVLYLIRVRATTEYVTGAALYQQRSGSPLEVGIANFYSKGGTDAGKLYRTLDEATDDALEIWKVNDLAAIRTAIAAGGKTDEQIGDAAFKHPPTLNNSQRIAVRNAIDAARGIEGEVFADDSLRWVVLAETQDLNGVATNAIRFTASAEGSALGMVAASDDQSITISAALPDGAIGWHVTLLNGSDILANTPILDGLGTYLVRSADGGTDRGLSVALEDQSGLQFRVQGRVNALTSGDKLQIRVAYFDAAVDTPAIAEQYRGTLGSVATEVELSGVTVINDANVIYVVRVGDDVLHIPGDDLYGTVAGQPWVLGPVNFYSKGDGKLYQDIFTTWDASTVLTVWQLVDVQGLKQILDEIEPNHVDELRADLAKLHTYIAEHVTDISEETLDPAAADAPEHYYLTEKARHEVGGHSIPYESGLYELTTGTANKTKIKLEKVGNNFWGYVTRGFGGHTDAGEMLHNPLSAVAAFYVELTDDGDYFAHAYIKKNVYDYLDGQVNLANTAVFFKITDGTTARQLEMGTYGQVVVGGINYMHMRSHLLTTSSQMATPTQWLAYFTDANSHAPTVDIGYNPSFPDAGRADYHLRYGGVNTTKAYTLRRSGFARLTGLHDDFIESATVRHIVAIGEAAYNALATKDPNTFYLRTGA